MEPRGAGGKAAARGGRGGSSRSHPYRKDGTRSGPAVEERVENKLYVGNLDHRMTEYHICKLFAPFGRVNREEFLWHTHGPKKGEPRGYAFVEYATRQEAERARNEMNGKIAFGRPLVVRFVDEKVVTYNMDAPVWTRDSKKSAAGGEGEVGSAAASKSAKIAAIKQKLKMMEREAAEEKGK